MAASLIIIAVFLASCGVWMRLLASWQRTEELLPYPATPRLRPGRWAVAFVWSWCLYQVVLSVFVPERTTPPSLQLVLSVCVTNAFVLIFLVAMLQPEAARTGLFGRAGGSTGRLIRIGGAAFLAAMAPVDLVLWSTMPLRRGQPPHVLLRLLQAHPDLATVSAVVLAAVILAPAVEELMFRVVIQSWLRQYVRPAPAILLTALVFVGLHGPHDAVALIPLALVLGYLFERTGSFWAVAVTHSLFNVYNILVMLLSQSG